MVGHRSSGIIPRTEIPRGIQTDNSEREESFLGRVIHTTNPSRRREAVLRKMADAVRAYSSSAKMENDAGDLTICLAACVREIRESVERTAAAWEKRDYWVKADAFRRQWSWVEEFHSTLQKYAQGGSLQDLQALVRTVEQRIRPAERSDGKSRDSFPRG
jgi:hypothetical protein